MNNTQIIAILVSVVLLLFLHYTTERKSCEYFGGTTKTVTPIQFNVTNKSMQQLLTKLSDFVYKYSNKLYTDDVMNKNHASMKEMMTKVQNKSFIDVLQMDSNQVNTMISYISSF